MELWVILLIGALVITAEVIGLTYWNMLIDKETKEKYQPYLDTKSCDELKDIVLFSNNSTLIAQTKINMARCLK